MSSVNKVTLEWRDNIILSGQSTGFKETRTSHKNIACIRNVSSFPQQLEQIPELTMDVPTDGYRTRHGLNVRFFHKNISDFIAE